MKGKARQLALALAPALLAGTARTRRDVRHGAISWSAVPALPVAVALAFLASAGFVLSRRHGRLAY